MINRATYDLHFSGKHVTTFSRKSDFATELGLSGLCQNMGWEMDIRTFFGVWHCSSASFYNFHHENDSDGRDICDMCNDSGWLNMYWTILDIHSHPVQWIQNYLQGSFRILTSSFIWLRNLPHLGNFDGEMEPRLCYYSWQKVWPKWLFLPKTLLEYIFRFEHLAKESERAPILEFQSSFLWSSQWGFWARPRAASWIVSSFGVGAERHFSCLASSDPKLNEEWPWTGQHCYTLAVSMWHWKCSVHSMAQLPMSQSRNLASKLNGQNAAAAPLRPFLLLLRPGETIAAANVPYRAETNSALPPLRRNSQLGRV